MSNVFFTSDWHLRHRNILKYRQGFLTIEDHDAALICNHLALVGKRDTTYFLGDMCFEVDDYAKRMLSSLKGNKILIMGNHDYANIKELLTVFDDVVGPIKYKGHWLSHHPIHPQELYGKRNIHGHTHNQVVLLDGEPDGRYINVCPDLNNMRPIQFEEILKL